MIKNFNNYINEDYNITRDCIILVGPPGSGKGTQASLISSKTGYDHVSTGDILRKSKKSEVKKILKKGDLVSDNLVYKELDNYIRKNMGSKGFILDGYPRNIKQKYYLDNILRDNNIKISHIFFLNVSEKEIQKRIKERGKTSGREDDTQDVLRNRMDEYRKNTLPLIEMMKKRNDFIEIKSDGDSSGVTKIIFDNIPEI